MKYQIGDSYLSKRKHFLVISLISVVFKTILFVEIQIIFGTTYLCHYLLT